MTEVEKIRSVAARFFNVPEAQMTESFAFPSERMQSSVARSTLHAAVKRLAGVDLPSAFKANTFGQLINGVPTDQAETSQAKPARVEEGLKPADRVPAIGIDIEHADNLPAAADPWAEPFYGEHFTAAEMAYCTRQTDSRLSFCGIWAAKEAAVKCGLFAGARLNDFTITHDEAGKPRLESKASAHAKTAGECVISISHSRGTAVAVCAWMPLANNRGAAMETVQPLSAQTNPPTPRRERSAALLWFTLLLSATAIALWVWKVVAG